MKKIRALIVSCTIAAVSHAALLSAWAQQTPPGTYGNPAQAKQLIERAMQSPQSQNSTAIYYSSGISHFDGFIPYMPGMTETTDQSKAHWKYTYNDGRIAKAEYIDASGNVIECYAVWNNSTGAPVLTGYRNKQGAYDWYMYAEFDPSGKIQALYRFNQSYELEFYDVFSYPDNATDIKSFSSTSQPRSETIYENGSVFMVENGEKRLVNRMDRQQEIRALTKLGLKPIYPGY